MTLDLGEIIFVRNYLSVWSGIFLFLEENSTKPRPFFSFAISCSFAHANVFFHILCSQTDLNPSESLQSCHEISKYPLRQLKKGLNVPIFLWFILFVIRFSWNLRLCYARHVHLFQHIRVIPTHAFLCMWSYPCEKLVRISLSIRP